VRRLRRSFARLLLLASGTPHDRYLEIDREVWVSPSSIRGRYDLPDSVLRNRGPGWVIGGDWDLDPSPFEQDMRFKAIRDVVVYGLPWEQTEHYRWAVQRIESGEPMWYCRTREEYEERCRSIERLYERIKTDGYLTQKELRVRRSDSAVGGKGDEITVAIGRHGEFLFIDGAHRLAIAKILDLPKIPVEVVLRHPDWMSFRLDVARYCEAHSGKAAQPLLHPDLDNIPSEAQCNVDYGLIKESLGETPGMLVDLGARWGYFCQRFEDAGFDCVAVEPSPDDRAALDRLRVACGKRFLVTDRLGDSMRQTIAERGPVVLALDRSRADGREALRALSAVILSLRPREVYVGLRSEGIASEVGVTPGDPLVSQLLDSGRFASRSTLQAPGGGRGLVRLAFRAGNGRPRA